MVFLGSLGAALPGPVVIFVDILIGLHLVALFVYAVSLSREVFGKPQPRIRAVARED